MLDLRSACTLGLFAASAALLPPSLEQLREFANWFARPASLPFAWHALNSAKTSGDAMEAFARGQQIMALVPSWTDGHSAFAFRFALTQDRSLDEERAAEAAERRLHIALAWIEQARPSAGTREVELLQMAAFLPEVACNKFPGLAERLMVRGGAAGMADVYLAAAERLRPSAAVREQRIFHTRALARALLANGDVQEAISVLRTAIDRVPEVRDQKLATEWRDRLIEVVDWLSGDRSVDRTAVFADRRLEPIWPFIR